MSQEHLVPSTFRYEVCVKMRKGEPWKKTTTAVTSFWVGKHLYNHMVFQHLWIKQGATRHRLAYVTNLPIHVKLDCVYYKISWDWVVSEGRSKGQTKVKWGTNAAKSADDSQNASLITMWTQINLVNPASITAMSSETQGIQRAAYL